MQKQVVGQRVGTGGTVAGLFGDEIMCCNQLPGDSWRWRHDDEIKLCIVKICNDSKIRAEAEVFGRFRDLIPAELTQPAPFFNCPALNEDFGLVERGPA